jgi:hypothetical protein
MPTDRTGENPGWKSSEPYYDDWYTVRTNSSGSPHHTKHAVRVRYGIVRSDFLIVSAFILVCSFPMHHNILPFSIYRSLRRDASVID